MSNKLQHNDLINETGACIPLRQSYVILGCMEAIGKIIEKKMREKRISVTEFAKMINTDRRNVYSIFKRENIDSGLLTKISNVLEHNFFEYFVPEHCDEPKILDEDRHYYPENDDYELLKKKLDTIKLELEYLKKQVKDKDKIIKLLEKKNK